MTRRSNTPYISAAAGVVFVSLSGIASAQVSGTTTSATTTSATTTSATTSASYSATSAVGQTGLSRTLSEAAATQLITTTTLRQMQTISSALASRSMVRTGPPAKTADSGQKTYGMAAGGAPGMNVWGNLSGDNSKYESGANKFNANSTNAVIGADYALSPALALGASLAFDRVTGAAGGSNYTANGYSLAPYLGWQINKDWALDAAMGWGQNDLGGSVGKADRFFYGTNLTYAAWYNNLQVTGKASYLYGEEKYKYTNASTNKLDQLRVGAQAGYWMDGAMPYAGVAYSTDSGRSGSATGATNDLGKNAWVWSLGVNFFSLKNSLTGGIVYNVESGRSNSKNESLMANINYRF